MTKTTHTGADAWRNHLIVSSSGSAETASGKRCHRLSGLYVVA